ncbi:membrane-bound lytic murein transglycosylase B [Kushneria sinocarnis]|uniref:Membrane-bound lytic murein transglycosylase B n=1 Tax=Kushneria sinocarnis TaxID=595502 RepID=A0A420WYU6_9GAMM|nr:lytic murein transglycosylase B [Kushneria sinocarnis]RKR06407.1 membrane-bound lytic murein transglycosylase B [Kushneria sinocarnis]
MKSRRFAGRSRQMLLMVLAAAGTLPGAGQAANDFDPASHPPVEQMIDQLSAQGLDRQALKRAMSDASHKQSIIDAISRPAEGRLSWEKYRDIFIQPSRVSAGVQFVIDHRQAMQRAEERYGVEPEVIAAIIGVETFYGRHKGSYRVIDSLSTLAFDYPRRADFFRKQLEAYLTLTLQQDLDPLSLKGSYAGAMGYPQFIPTSYQAYAVDFDNDGVRDLWHEPVDAIGSVANYLAEHGWQHGQPVMIPAQASGTPDDGISFNAVSAPDQPVSRFEKMGITPERSLAGDTRVMPLALDFEDGHKRYAFGLNNFYVITRYNHSHLYAAAVTTLAERIHAELNQDD